MIDIKAHLFALITSDPIIGPLLSTHGGIPAVFDTASPDKYETQVLPHVVIDAPIGNARSHENRGVGRQISINLRIYAKVKFTQAGATFYDTLQLHEAAELIAKKLDESFQTVAGGTFRGTQIDGPTQLTTPDRTISGHLIQTQFFIKET